MKCMWRRNGGKQVRSSDWTSFSNFRSYIAIYTLCSILVTHVTIGIDHGCSWDTGSYGDVHRAAYREVPKTINQPVECCYGNSLSTVIYAINITNISLTEYSNCQFWEPSPLGRPRAGHTACKQVSHRRLQVGNRVIMYTKMRMLLIDFA